MLEINISHGTKRTWENSFAACLLKYIHQACHCLFSTLIGEVLFLLKYLSLLAMKIWGLLLIYTRATVPHSGPAEITSRGTHVLHTTGAQ